MSTKVEKTVRQSFQARLLKENHAWLQEKGLQQERSINWLLDNLVTKARQADQATEGREKNDECQRA